MKIAIAILATLAFIFLAFAFPIMYRWYIVTYKITEGERLLPFMVCSFVWMGMFVWVVVLWVKAIYKL